MCESCVNEMSNEARVRISDLNSDLLVRKSQPSADIVIFFVSAALWQSVVVVATFAK